jgi:hypothetical protein
MCEQQNTSTDVQYNGLISVDPEPTSLSFAIIGIQSCVGVGAIIKRRRPATVD